MKIKEAYFMITVFYAVGNRTFLIKEGILKKNSSITGSRSGHVVKATSKKRALEIAEKHGIAYPFNSKFVEGRKCKKLDILFPYDMELIKRRSKGIGGYIWYEDENGNLQKE